MMEVTEALQHPFTALTVALGAIGHIAGAFEPAWSLLSATAGLWFPATAVSAGTILPEIGYPELGTTVLLGAASLFVAVQLDKLVDRVQDWRENR